MGVCRCVFLACVVAVLAACTHVKSDVTRFDDLPSSVDNTRFYVLPLEDQQLSLEYARYADIVSEHLETEGLVEVGSIKKADVIVSFDYGTADSKQVQGSMPIFGQTGGGTTYHQGSAYDYGGGGYTSYSGTSYTPPTYGQIGSVPYSETLYTRYLFLSILSTKQTGNGELEPLYQAKVISIGSNSSFAPVSDCMLGALFEDFRKEGTERVVMPMRECE